MIGSRQRPKVRATQMALQNVLTQSLAAVVVMCAFKQNALLGGVVGIICVLFFLGETCLEVGRT